VTWSDANHPLLWDVMERRRLPAEIRLRWRIFVCPGCQGWQIDLELDAPEQHQVGSLIYEGWADAASADHRRDCPGLDLLAGLTRLHGEPT